MSGFRKRKGRKNDDGKTVAGGTGAGTWVIYGVESAEDEKALDSLVEQFLGPGATRTKGDGATRTKGEGTSQIGGNAQRDARGRRGSPGQAGEEGGGGVGDESGQGGGEGGVGREERGGARVWMGRGDAGAPRRAEGEEVGGEDGWAGGGAAVQRVDVAEVVEVLEQAGAGRLMAELAATCAVEEGGGVGQEWRGVVEGLQRGLRVGGAGLCEMVTRCPRLLRLSAARVAGVVEVLRQEVGMDAKSARYVVTRRYGAGGDALERRAGETRQRDAPGRIFSRAFDGAAGIGSLWTVLRPQGCLEAAGSVAGSGCTSVCVCDPAYAEDEGGREGAACAIQHVRSSIRMRYEWFKDTGRAQVSACDGCIPQACTAVHEGVKDAAGHTCIASGS